jgi:hypothetical protein
LRMSGSVLGSGMRRFGSRAARLGRMFDCRYQIFEEGKTFA